jgi:putative transposase
MLLPTESRFFRTRFKTQFSDREGVYRQYELYCKLSLLFERSYVKRSHIKIGGKAMLVFEFKAYGKQNQFNGVDEAIRTAQFIRNSCLRYWMDHKKVDRYDLNKYCAVLARDFPFADELNSMARQSSAERAWSAISRFYENCKKGIPGKKGYPQFQKNCRSVEYKTSGWKLADDRKSINFIDKKGIGRLKVKGTRDLHFYQISQIKRVRLVKRADGVYV